jgi:DNA-binding transcriptional regulator PaaX
MEKRKNSKYLFQKRKTSFTKRLFKEGLTATSYILFAIKDFSESFPQDLLNELPDCYPGFKFLKDMFGCNSKKEFKKNTIRVNIFRLKKQGLIAEAENKKFYLTDEGKKMVAYIKDRYSILEKPWDKKLRLVVFDIPETEKYFRKWLRAELGLLMFKQLQKSVYIGKYPIPDDLYQDLIKNNLFQNVHIFTINEADKQKELMKILEK